MCKLKNSIILIDGNQVDNRSRKVIGSINYLQLHLSIHTPVVIL